MNSKNIIEEKYPDIPEGVEKSLCECGGVDGLIEKIPEDSRINAQCEFHRALADPRRMKILVMLDIQPLCVCVIKAVLDVSDSKLSYHLSSLKKTGLIEGHQEGNWIIYSITEKGKMWVQLLNQ